MKSFIMQAYVSLNDEENEESQMKILINKLTLNKFSDETLN
jgi:hypothetical protein